MNEKGRVLSSDTLLAQGREEVRVNLSLLKDKDLTYNEVCVLAKKSLVRGLERGVSRLDRIGMLLNCIILPAMGPMFRGQPLMYVANQKEDVLLECAAQAYAGAALAVMEEHLQAAKGFAGDLAEQTRWEEAETDAQAALKVFFERLEKMGLLFIHSVEARQGGMILEMFMQMGKGVLYEKAAAAAACAVTSELLSANAQGAIEASRPVFELTRDSFASALSENDFSENAKRRLEEAISLTQAMYREYQELDPIGSLKREALEKTREEWEEILSRRKKEDEALSDEELEAYGKRIAAQIKEKMRDDEQRLEQISDV